MADNELDRPYSELERRQAVRSLTIDWPYHDSRVLYEADGDSIENIAVFLQMKLQRLLAERDHPETEDFFRGVPLEAAHQRARWPSEQDAGKTPGDWFWLVGYLAGKCLAAHIAGNREKALHHTISTAAALANWHLAIKGVSNMRPGIDTPTEGKGVQTC